MREIVSPLSGIRSPFGSRRFAFSPLSLFASGEEGAWYEPSPTTCFTDTGGTVAATYGDAVAYLQDKSGNGNHATQSTASARPILARVPEGGRRNELSETDTLATQSVTVTAAERTLSFTGTGTVTLTGASTAGPLVGTGAGDRVSLTFTPSAGSLTLTVSGTVTDAQLELGSAATNYQFVADLLGFDVTEAGVTSLDYLSFNADDGMATASIDFTATDKMSVFAGVLSNTAAGTNVSNILAELSASSGANNGSFGIFAPIDNGGTEREEYGALLRGSLNDIAAYNETISEAHVTSALFDIGAATNASQIVFRSDGSALTPTVSATDAGTGNFGNHPLNIGARNNAASNWFDGHLYGLIVRGASSTAGEIAGTEAYLANRSGVTL